LHQDRRTQIKLHGITSSSNRAGILHEAAANGRVESASQTVALEEGRDASVMAGERIITSQGKGSFTILRP
jgi:hypothetical protein